jgi:hypothetical protein
VQASRDESKRREPYTVDEEYRAQSLRLGNVQERELGLEFSRKSAFPSRSASSHAQPPSIAPSIRRHVQETFGRIQDIRCDPKLRRLNSAPEIILAPLRTSDRKKLKQRVIEGFSLSPEIGDLLVPEGLLSVKYTSHSRVPGVRVLE